MNTFCKSIGLFISALICSCSNYETVNDTYFDHQMTAFLCENLRYPQSADDYCLRTYKMDSLNFFHKSMARYFSINRENADTIACLLGIPRIIFTQDNCISYDSFYEVMDSAYTRIEADRVVGSLHFKPLVLEPYLHQNRLQIKFKQKKGKFIMINSSSKVRWETIDMTNQYEKYRKCICEDPSINYKKLMLEQVRFYTKDSIAIDIDTDLVCKTEAVQEKIRSIFKRNIAKQTDTNMSRCIICYSRDGNITTHLSNCDVPIYIKQSIELRDYLNTIFRENKDVYYVVFGTWEESQHSPTL